MGKEVELQARTFCYLALAYSLSFGPSNTEQNSNLVLFCLGELPPCGREFLQARPRGAIELETVGQKTVRWIWCDILIA